jgi:hypothetical protein
MKREIQVDADWQESVIWAVFVLILSIVVAHNIYEFMTLSSRFSPLRWHAGIRIVYLSIFIYAFHDRRIRAGLTLMLASIALRAVAQLLIQDADFIRTSGMTSRFLDICGAILVLVFLASEARQRIKIVEVHHNA